MDTLLQDYINVAVSRGAILELIYLWLPTIFMGKDGMETRNAINSTIPTLAEHFFIPITEDIQFPEFVKLYDEHVYNSIEGSPNERLEHFSKEGNWRGVQTAINKGANEWNYAIFEAAKAGNRNLVEFFLTRSYKNNVLLVLGGAATGNQVELFKSYMHLPSGYDLNMALGYAAQLNYGVEYFLEMGAKDWNLGVKGAAYGGHKELVEFFLNKGAHCIEGFKGAVEGNKIELIQYFIGRLLKIDIFAVNIWHTGLEVAASRNHVHLVKYFIDKGATNLEGGINTAISYGSRDVVLFLLGKGCCDFNTYLHYALVYKDTKLIKLFVTKGANNLNTLKSNDLYIKQLLSELTNKII